MRLESCARLADISAILCLLSIFFFFNDTATTEIYTLSLHDALPITALGVGQRLREEPVGEPRIAGQEGAVEVRADRPPDATALEAAVAVVAEPCDDAAERLRADVEMRTAGVVLEARERALHARLELALEQAVADHPRVAGDGVER